MTKLLRHVGCLDSHVCLTLHACTRNGFDQPFGRCNIEPGHTAPDIIVRTKLAIRPNASVVLLST